MNRTEHDLTDSNYNFMKEVLGQTETKVIHKQGNEQYYLIVAQQWHKLLNKVKNINVKYVLAVSYTM